MELSKMLGAERNVPFRVKGLDSNYKIDLNRTRKYETLYIEMGKSTWLEVCHVPTIIKIISGAPDNIIHLPPSLTDEQREQLRAIWTLGGRWLAKDCDGVVNYYTKIPYKESGYWFDNDDAERYGYAIPLSAGVCELQELNDVDEPFDIGKALGVEG